MSVAEIVQKIQYMIAPAVMVSSSALLLLGFHNKFSNLASRFRVLNQEKRLLSQKVHHETAEALRLKSLVEQVDQLMKRASLVKNSILFTYLAIICFVSTSIFIFLNVYVTFQLNTAIAVVTPFQLNYAIAVVILAGFLSLVAACTFMILETMLFYRVIAIEKKT